MQNIRINVSFVDCNVDHTIRKAKEAFIFGSKGFQRIYSRRN